MTILRFLFCFILLMSLLNAKASISDQNTYMGTITPLKQNESPPFLEIINGTRNYKMHGKKGKDDKTWFDGREMKHTYCVRPSKCEKLQFNTCLGSPLPYNYTSLDLSDSYSQNQTLERLTAYQALRHVPKCWAVIQPFLCAVFVPKCEKIHNSDLVYLPSVEMCKITSEPCRILYNTSYFPEFLKCNETLFPSKCNNDVREMKFNATGQCLRPLVMAESSANYYRDIEGCGLQCKDPLYTEDEHRQIHKLIAWGATICLLFNLFAILTFMIDWQNANKYPALIIFYINVCYLMSSFGWLAQFTPGGREDIVCRKDGTLRHSEPSAGENLSCIVVFILVYYFILAAMVWFVIFTYAWHMSFKVIGKIHERIDKKGSYFHLVAWSLPLVLTITIMALSEVDGNSVVGICFVGYLNHSMRASFLLGPIFGVFLVGGYFLSGGMLTLIKLKISSKEIISTRASNKIRETIVRMGLCTLFILVFILATIFCHIHEFRNYIDWAESLRSFIICQISSTYVEHYHVCKMNTRPSVAVLQLHLLCLFASGIVMSSWVWTHSTIDIWSRYIKRKFGYNVVEPVKLQKHKLIAQAFAKRKEFQDQGRLSISFHNSHTDPVGLNFNIDSVASHDFSSTWANNLPRFVNRRCALTGAATSSSHGGPRRNSMDSEISFSVRHVSVESRRNSIDSQVSVKIAEMKTKVASRNHRSGAGGKSSSKSRSRRRDFSASNKRFSRRESSTSMESQKLTAIQRTGYSEKGNGFFMPKNKNMKRRSASAGLDADQINALLTNGKLLLPFLQNQGMTTSDDENGSMTSFRVKDSRLDVILKQVGKFHANNDENSEDDDDLNNFDTRNGAGSGINVQEYNTTDDEKMNRKKSAVGDYQNIQDILDNAMKSNDDVNSSKNSKEGGRNSKNSAKSIKSRKSSSRRSRKNSRSISKSCKAREIDSNKKEKGKNSNIAELDIDDSSFTSYCSELSPPDGGGSGGNGIQSSFSGISVEKTNSRSSKRSCDVGVQTNAHEIATQTMSSYDDDDDEDDDDDDDDDEHNNNDDDSTKNNRNYLKSIDKNTKNDGNDDVYTENHQLLPPSSGGTVLISGHHGQTSKRRDTMKKRDDRTMSMSMTETDKLKMLLLPSK